MRNLIFLTILIGLSSFSADKNEKLGRPNILWITIEDYSPHLGCYGVEEAITPVIDKFASEGVMYNIAWATAPVCAVNRTSILTGVYPTTLGAHQMRSSIKFPSQLLNKTYPELMKQAGYYCTNPDKTDYNFDSPSKNVIWDDASATAHYRNRPDKSQPFFHVVNFNGTHQGSNEQDDIGSFDPNKLPLPPYYPDTKLTRRVFATYFNNLTQVESQISDVLEILEKEGEKENTIIFFYSDHGAGLPRAKWWPYDAGLREPFIILIPEKYRLEGQGVPGTKTNRMISNLDLAPTVLNLAGITIPEVMQGRPFLGENLPPKRKYLYAASDRQGASHDIIRSVRNERYVYIRNYEYWKPVYQYAHFNEEIIMKEIRKGYAEGTLTPLQAQYLEVPKPIEELYDLNNDPYEINNLAKSPAHNEILKELREAHRDWRKKTRDLGVFPEGMLLEERDNYRSEYEMGIKEALRIEKLWATLESLHLKSKAELKDLLRDEDQVLRYWAAIGLGNLESHSSDVTAILETALADSSKYVQVAAARGLLMNSVHEGALHLLQQYLSNKNALGVATALAYNDAGNHARSHENILKERLNGSFSNTEPGNRMKDIIKVALKTIIDEPTGISLRN